MQLYAKSTQDFLAHVATGALPQMLADAYKAQILSRPSPSEVRSWERSLGVLSADIEAAGIQDGGILVEHSLPLSSKRIDALMFGRSRTGTAQPLLVELKQWTSGDIGETDGTLITVAGRLLLHPRLQVAQYVEYLSDFHPSIDEGKIQLSGLAYLHDATDRDAAAILSAELEEVENFPLITGDGRDWLRELIANRLAGGDGMRLMENFIDERTRPSKKLLEHVAAEIEGNPSFTLLDDQLVAYEATRKAVERARDGEGKSVVIVTGGPGSGKSVIATRMVGDFAKRGWNISHATGSRAFTTTLRKRVGRRAANVFRYFNQFGDAEQNELDVLICDEAHRIRETSNSRFTPKHKRTDLPQVEELIQVAKVPVFLLDENQGVRPYEIGKVSVIEEAAERNDAQIIEVELNGQFRCMGSAAYIEWVRRFLGIEPGGPIRWDEEEDFELVWSDSPERLEAWLSAKQEEREGITSRMAAGFCWPWSDPRPDGTLIDDVVIEDWVRPWNAKPGKKVKDAPKADLWASDPGGFDQVGCIYTAQGFEYDYGGVIIGPDMKWGNGAWATDKSESHDNIVKRAPNFDELVRNTYKVLLTRGLSGCGIYAMDDEAADRLAKLIPTRV